MRRRRGRMRMKRIRLHKSVDYSEYERRNAALLELGFKDYKQYLRSKLWKSIRRTQLALEPLCYGCGRKSNQIHHTVYKIEVLTGKSTEGLVSTCARCHRWCEFTRNGFKRSPEQASLEFEKVRKMCLQKVGWEK